MPLTLKRSRSEAASPAPASAPASAPELAACFPERLAPMFSVWDGLPAGLLAVFDELDAMPHVPIPAPSTEREGHIKALLVLDTLFEATEKARVKAKDAWWRTQWQQKQSCNLCVLDGQVEQEDGTVLPDGCGICGVDKPECVNPAEHFGARGESPPDAVCPHCKFNFYNRHDSQYALLRHLAQKHGGKA